MKKIIFLGDSITDASHCFLENPLGNGYVNMVAEKLNDSDGGRKKYDIMNRGHDGFTIHGVKRILEKECILKRPDVVSILIGCNDVGVMMNTGKSLEEQQFEACYEAIFTEEKHTSLDKAYQGRKSISLYLLSMPTPARSSQNSLSEPQRLLPNSSSG